MDSLYLINSRPKILLGTHSAPQKKKKKKKKKKEGKSLYYCVHAYAQISYRCTALKLVETIESLFKEAVSAGTKTGILSPARKFHDRRSIEEGAGGGRLVLLRQAHTARTTILRVITVASVTV